MNDEQVNQLMKQAEEVHQQKMQQMQQAMQQQLQQQQQQAQEAMQQMQQMMQAQAAAAENAATGASASSTPVVTEMANQKRKGLAERGTMVRPEKNKSGKQPFGEWKVRFSAWAGLMNGEMKKALKLAETRDAR